METKLYPFHSNSRDFSRSLAPVGQLKCLKDSSSHLSDIPHRAVIKNTVPNVRPHFLPLTVETERRHAGGAVEDSVTAG